MSARGRDRDGMGGLDVYTVRPCRPLTGHEKRRGGIRAAHAVLAAMPDAPQAEKLRALAELLDCLGIRDQTAKGAEPERRSA